MSLEIDLLRVLLRLAHRRTSPTIERLVVRVGREEAEVCRALAALAKRGFVQRAPAGLRLTLAGLAVALACAPRPRERLVAPPDAPSTLPLVRRRAA